MLRFCKKCGTLYSDSLGVCPRCNATEVAEHAREAEIASGAADRETVKHNWIFLLIGIPAFIGLMYGLVWLFRSCSLMS